MGMSPASFAVSELIEVARRCNPNLDAIRAITWQAAGPVEESWQQWLDGVFEPLLLPHLRRVIDFSARQSSKEIILLDLDLDRNLDPWTRDKSLDAGTRFLRQATLRAERLMVKLHEAIDSGIAFGHFATLYAVRCGTFSIPVRTAILSYVLQELVVGAPVDIKPVKYLEAAVESVNEFLRMSSDGVNEGLRFHG
jgi:UreF-like urease accessory protein